MKKPVKKPLTAKLRSKNGRLYAVIKCVGPDGKSKEVWRTLDLEDKPGNKRKAYDKMEELKNRMRGIMDVPGYGISFIDYLHEFLEKKKYEVEESSFDSVERMINGKIIPFFAPMNYRLSELEPRAVRDFYEFLYKSGRSDGTGGLSISSIKSAKSILNEVYKDAIVDELVINNPVEPVKLPAKDNPRKPHIVLTKESADRLLGSIIDDELMYPLLLLTLTYGLRKSEVIGLKWSAVDFQKNELRIESVIVNGKKPEKNRTKTKTSNASFPILSNVREVLEKRKLTQEKHRKEYGKEYVETDYVFTDKSGNYLKPNWVTKQFKRILAQSGLPEMRFHDLRHSTSCILYGNGMKIKELQQWMRHGKIEMTADVYLHISKEKENELANGLRNMLSGKSESNAGFIEKATNMA